MSGTHICMKQTLANANIPFSKMSKYHYIESILRKPRLFTKHIPKQLPQTVISTHSKQQVEKCSNCIRARPDSLFPRSAQNLHCLRSHFHMEKVTHSRIKHKET